MQPNNDIQVKTKTNDLLPLAGTILMSICFATYFLPAAYALETSLYNVWRVAICVVSCIVIILYLAKCTIHIRWILLILFLLMYYLISTILNSAGGGLTGIAFSILKVSGFITLLEYGLTINREMCIKSFLFAGILLCAVHYATFLEYRDYSRGMRQNAFNTYGEISSQHWFFFTHDNGSVFYFLPVLSGVWYYACEKNRGYWFAGLLSALALYMYWSLWTVTAMVAMTFAVALFVVICKTDCIRIRSWLSYRKALLIGVAFCVIILVFYSNDLFAIVANALGKSTDFGRGRIWSRAISYFLKSPIIGVGLENDTTIALKLGINHCHNILIQVLYTGGILSAVLLGLGLLKYGKAGKNSRGFISKPQAILCVAIIALFISATFDWYLYMPIQFFPFVLYAYSEQPDELESKALYADTFTTAPINSTASVSNLGYYSYYQIRKSVKPKYHTGIQGSGVNGGDIGV